MTHQTEAVYEHGVLKLDEPLELEDGTRVEVTIHSREQKEPPDPKRVAEWLAEIAAMPMERDTDGFSGEDHDKVLYGENGAV